MEPETRGSPFIQPELHLPVHDDDLHDYEEEPKIIPQIPLQEVEVTVHAYDVAVEDDFQSEGKTHIHFWCLDQNSNPYLLRSKDFPVFCYLELPQHIGGRQIAWEPRQVNKVIDSLKFMLREDAPIGFEFKRMSKIYYHQGNKKYPMIFLIFNTVRAMMHCLNLIKKPRNIPELGMMNLKMWETNISVIRKFFTLKDTRYSQWFKAVGLEVPIDHEQRISKPGTPDKPIREIIIDWKKVQPLPSSETKGWSTTPRILVFDIETYSDNHKAMPCEYKHKHVSYMISCVYQVMGKPETRKRYAIIYGDCDEITPTPEHPVEAEVFRVSSEMEMIEKFAEVVNLTDPEILSGYNIFGYDYPVLDVRLGLRNKSWPEMGRLFNRPPLMEAKSWKSSAYGHNKINILKMDGRISIDMLPIIRRDFKLDKYSLDFVSKTFLGKGKHDVKASTMFVIFEKLQEAIKAVQNEENEITRAQLASARTEMTKVMRYCIQDSELVVELFDKMNVWIGLVELSNVVGVTIMDLFTRGQQIRCLSQLYDRASRAQYVINRRNVPKTLFNGGFVFEPIPGLYENIICLDFASLYPSIIEALNICFTTLVPPELENDVPDELCNIIEFDQEEDAEVKRQRPADDDIYKITDEGPNEGFAFEDVADDDEPKVKITKHYRFKWIKREVKEGILPKLVHDLVAERNQVKKQMGQVQASMKSHEKASEFRSKFGLPYTDGGKTYIEEMLMTAEDYKISKLIVNVLDKRQLALKVSANSLFGFLGAQEGGVLPLIEGAMCITAMGRQLIGTVNERLMTEYNAKVVYNDSVTGETPILIRRNGGMEWLAIEDLFEQLSFNAINDGKERIATSGIEVWSDQGWTRIKQVIRHKTGKEIFRVQTDSGFVDVTEDHSLLDPFGNAVFPWQVKVGEKLLHADLPPLSELSKAFLKKGEGFLVQVAHRYHLDSPTESWKDEILYITSQGFVDDYVYDLETENHHFSAGVGRIVVHNTDSSMVDMGITDRKAVNKKGKELAITISGQKEERDEDGKIIKPEVQGWFPPPLRMEFEKGMRLLCIKKKKYAAYLIDGEGEFKKDKETGEFEILRRGIMTARRDSSFFARDHYNQLLRIVLNRSPITVAFDHIVDACNKLLSGQVPIEGNLTIIRELGSDYKQVNYFMNVFAQALRALGKPANPGDRLEYVIVKTNEEYSGLKVDMGKKMREIEMFMETRAYFEAKRQGKIVVPSIKELDPQKLQEYEEEGKEIVEMEKPVLNEEEIDYVYYIEHQLMNPFDQLFEVGYQELLSRYESLGYQPQFSRSHFCSIKTPIKMIAKMINDYQRGGVPLGHIRTQIEGMKRIFYEQNQPKKALFKIVG